MPAHIALDANLAVLLAVGAADTDYIRAHRRLQDYDVVDFRVLDEALGLSAGVVWSPHVLAETSNLASQIHGEVKPRVLDALRRLIALWEERPVSSQVAASRSEFLYLGLTDAALLTLAEAGVVIMTADGRLHEAALRAGYQSVHFAELRQERRSTHLQD